MRRRAVIAEVLELAADVALVAEQSGRRDLADRLRARAGQSERRGLEIVVIGSFKVGKSALINSLLSITSCFEYADESTTVPLMLRYGDDWSAAVHDEHDLARSADVDELHELLRRPWPGARSVTLTVPRRLLAPGLVVVDTPGIGGLASASGLQAVAAAMRGTAVIFVTEATRELTASELWVLRRISNSGTATIVVETKADLTRMAERIAAIDRGHLDRAGLDHIPIVTVSVPVRRVALQTDDREANARSGFRELTAALLTVSESAVDQGLILEMTDVVEQLIDTIQTARGAIAGTSEVHLGSVAAARLRAEALRRASARWQSVLADAMAAFTSDSEYDLRTRLRSAMAWVDEEIDSSDPARSWDVVCHGLDRVVAEELLAHDQFVRDRIESISERVARHFTDAGVALTISTADPIDTRTLTAIAPASLEIARSGVLTTALTTLRGSYGGLAMFGLLGSVAGLTLLNPITLVAGVSMGGKAARDERARQLAQRRAQARAACRRVIDDLTLHQVKQTRDTARRVQVALRDAFVARVDEIQVGVEAAIRAAQQSSEAASAIDLDAQWHRLELLRTAISRLGDSDRAHLRTA